MHGRSVETLMPSSNKLPAVLGVVLYSKSAHNNRANLRFCLHIVLKSLPRFSTFVYLLLLFSDTPVHRNGNAYILDLLPTREKK